eukprot:CAMPEP_0170492052 /NCGR_PEP_ID=MMETSP0208-20121228/11601_1 /TAXON_ID=197538 /ORGANISM="Strombidium inclinatum, Strain S3" /LENGTH=160 /DNA_ID=CAMNT_0010767739 /DNA_START=11 /DNA_END=493 /DNA_ORIENTATION=+
MSILLRSKLDAAYTDYFNHLQKHYGGIPQEHQAAINMRMLFIKQYILDRQPNDYRTPIERDWSFIVRREYRYDVNIRACTDALAAGLGVSLIRQVMIRKFVIWPMLPVAIGTYIYRQRALGIFYNKKFFDMCNVGEQYELGFARNAVLQKCNQLLDREDF